MMTRAALILVLVVGPLLAQDPPKGKCGTCNGPKTVKCFSCEGKTGSQIPCPVCPEGGIKCPGCQGPGTLMCVSCGGAGKAGGDQLKCCTCGGDGKLDCLLCDKGTVDCTRCKGDGKVNLECPTCAKSGHLRCPECAGYGAGEKCPACSGSKQEKCLACAGQGELPKPCDTCRGLGLSPCGTCYGHGKQTCSNCLGGGKFHKSGEANTNMLDKCDECKGKGCSACTACKGKGYEACTQCKGKKGEKVACWWCGGAKTNTCRRCVGPTQKWTGKHEASGVVVTVLACQDLEPQFSLALKEAANLADYRVWRVIVDGREATGPLQVGGGDGWALSGVSGGEVPMMDTSALFAPEVAAALARKLPSWGAAPEAFQSPVKVGPKEVKVRLLISDRTLSPDAQIFRMRLLSGAEKEWELAAQPLTVDGWIAICVDAAKAAKK